MVNSSILLDIKKLLGIPKTDTEFDPDIIMYINSAFAMLSQMGVSSYKTISISSEDDVWPSQITGELELVKMYVYFKVKMMFDPSTNSAILSATKEQLIELECRIQAIVDL